jgi:hypothetical protein
MNQKCPSNLCAPVTNKKRRNIGKKKDFTKFKFLYGSWNVFSNLYKRTNKVEFWSLQFEFAIWICNLNLQFEFAILNLYKYCTGQA